MKYICTHCKKEIQFEDKSYSLDIFNLNNYEFKKNVLCEDCMNKLIDEGKLE